MDIFSGFWLFFVCNGFQVGFTLFCIICILGRVVGSKKTKEEFINIHSSVNLSLAIGAVLTVLSLAAEFYVAYSDTSSYEEFSSVYFSVISFIAGWLFSLLFLLRRLRNSWILGIVIIILWNSGTILSPVKVVKNDYLPVPWSTDENTLLFTGLGVLFFGAVVFVVYRLLVKRKMLPYPSA